MKVIYQLLVCFVLGPRWIIGFLC